MVLPVSSQFASSVSFFLVFLSTAIAAFRAVLRPVPDAATVESSTTLALHLESPPEAATWTLALTAFTLVPALVAYIYTRQVICRPSGAHTNWRPCASRQQAYVYATLALFAALAGPIVFVFAWAQQIGIRLAAAAYGALAGPTFILYLVSGTPFPALFRRLPNDPYYTVED